jgi:hypothetical protein
VKKSLILFTLFAIFLFCSGFDWNSLLLGSLGYLFAHIQYRLYNPSQDRQIEFLTRQLELSRKMLAKEWQRNEELSVKCMVLASNIEDLERRLANEHAASKD